MCTVDLRWVYRTRSLYTYSWPEECGPLNRNCHIWVHIDVDFTSWKRNSALLLGQSCAFGESWLSRKWNLKYVIRKNDYFPCVHTVIPDMCKILLLSVSFWGSTSVSLTSLGQSEKNQTGPVTDLCLNYGATSGVCCCSALLGTGKPCWPEQ
jgi:hypothetical protein